MSIVVKFSNYDLGTDVLSNLMKVFSDIHNGIIMVDMLKFTYALYVHPISVNKLSCWNLLQNIVEYIPNKENDNFIFDLKFHMKKSSKLI